MLLKLGESAASYQTLFWVAFIPAVLSVAMLTFVKEKPRKPHQRESISQNWQLLSPSFKRFLIPAGVFALGYYSLGFLLLKAHQVGFSIKDTVLLYALFNGVCVIAAPIVGWLGDKIGRSHIILLGYMLYSAINIVLIFAHAYWQMIILFALYGVFYAIDEAQAKAFIADLEPERRATAVGIYNFVTGALYLPASVIAGILWIASPNIVFGFATALSLFAIAVFLQYPPINKNFIPATILQ